MPASSVSLDAIRAEQLRRLRRRLPELLRDNPFYRDRLHPVEGWDDFERLPFLSKAEIVADQAAVAPFGSNLTYPLDRYVRLHQTSGSSGTRPLRWLDTAESWEWWERIWSEHVYPPPASAPATASSSPSPSVPSSASGRPSAEPSGWARLRSRAGR